MNTEKKNKSKKKTSKSKNINEEVFSFQTPSAPTSCNEEMVSQVKPECPFTKGDIVKIIKTGELGIVIRTRLFGNDLYKNIIIKTKIEGKKLISVDEIEKSYMESI
jgi:hypothetical protein